MYDIILTVPHVDADGCAHVTDGTLHAKLGAFAEERANDIKLFDCLHRTF